MLQPYRTIARPGESEIEEKRSRFLGALLPVTTEEEVAAKLSELRTRYWDARHNVFAYRLREGGRSRFSDDGEPQGTAGMPVLEVLQKRDLCDCLLVVTRYFGGVLLGTGGLVRAYSQAASQAAEAAGVVIMTSCDRCELTCDYGDYGRLAALIPAFQGQVNDTAFGAQVIVTFTLPQTAMGFDQALADATGGRVSCRRLGEVYCPAPTGNQAPGV